MGSIRENLEEIRKLKQQLEYDISNSLSKLTTEFSDKVGFDVVSISVYMINITCVGDERPRTIVGKSTVELENI